MAATLSTPASASCFQMRSDVNGAINYLLCLHNEHVDLINEHAQALNDQQATLRTLSKAALQADSNGLEAARRIDTLEAEVRELRNEVDALKAGR
ncbi:hypothetical protein FJ434_16455 [Mesorhizobium sp. B2-5-13]|uniref:hypothetical protein n=1 Tax=unclassified Mesorhizobium TaxID=325217 RepID=UPI00112A0FBB|nr:MULTISPECIES: hypothetical protein [unclassified Mesorhizobium]TPJ85516.1 hypothetical protein FJ434_16455 [Mesorhizobium sp. B2-5-13]TPK39272.1 hypothetical protein FJ560_29405 [Mesorhizobium sp. B2-5-5]